jgi:hypothetical protein
LQKWIDVAGIFFAFRVSRRSRIFQKLKRCWNFFHVESGYIHLGDVFQRKTFEFEPGPIFIVETEQEVFATPN